MHWYKMKIQTLLWQAQALHTRERMACPEGLVVRRSLLPEASLKITRMRQ